MIARQTPTPRPRRIPAVGAAAGARGGVVLVVVAACTSRPAPPEPTAAAAGSLNPTTTSTTRTTTTTPTPTSETAPYSSEPPPPPSTSAVDPTTTTPTTTATPSSTTTSTPPPPSTAATQGQVMPAAEPVAISIPAIGTGSDLLHLGLNSDGSMATPPIDEKDSHAGWFDQSPEPGTLGPAIVVGHIDSARYGPAVFYDLGKLVPGDTVEITRSDGTVAVFGVDGVREYEKNDFPTLQVYGNLDHAGLRLITCGGVFNDDTGHYESNIVVFASLVATRAA